MPPQDEQHDSLFSWKPLYAEIAAKLSDFSGESDKLFDLSVRMHEPGLKVSSVTDKDDGDVEIPLEEVDPFSFFANFNRGTTDVNRRAILSAIKDEWQLNSPLPEDFDGLPLMSSQNSWFMPFKKLREAEHVETLWRFYLHCLELESAEQLDTAQFDACRSLRRVTPASLTMGIFWSRPDLWIAVDRKHSEYAAILGVDATVSSGEDYLRGLRRVRQKSDLSTCEFSFQAHLHSLEEPPPSEDDQDVEEPDADEGHNYCLLAPGQGAVLWDSWYEWSAPLPARPLQSALMTRLVLIQEVSGSAQTFDASGRAVLARITGVDVDRCQSWEATLSRNESLPSRGKTVSGQGRKSVQPVCSGWDCSPKLF